MAAAVDADAPGPASRTAVKAIAAKGLQKLGVDRALHQPDAGQNVERVSPGASPSRLIGAVAFWFIFRFAISAAVSALEIPALTAFLADVQSYLPNVVAAVLIFVVAAALAGVVGGLAHKLMGDTPTGRVGLPLPATPMPYGVTTTTGASSSRSISEATVLA